MEEKLNQDLNPENNTENEKVSSNYEQKNPDANDFIVDHSESEVPNTESLETKADESEPEIISEDADESEVEENFSKEKLESEIAICKEKLLRIAAEYENFRKRSEREKNAIFSLATETALLQLLPVIDSLELAFDNIQNVDASCEKGIEMVKNQLISALEKLKVSSFGKVGDEFTPKFHSAVSSIPGNGENSNTISEVFQKGYKYQDKIIRHAMVQVVN
ncbi:MAG: nucleotide exchange factor GrpE [Candidatus Improbicoccus devescovinae]|nr:MAG: nucleotide exchange factor GrpE [Candidatus Improbicoccus devescovinae]